MGFKKVEGSRDKKRDGRSMKKEERNELRESNAKSLKVAEGKRGAKSD
jgi:hypothetical protein